MALQVPPEQVVHRLTATRKERRRRGKCSEFGCSKRTGDSFRCAEHAEEHARRMREARARKRAS